MGGEYLPCSAGKLIFILPALNPSLSPFNLSINFSASSFTLSFGVISTANHGCPLYRPLYSTPSFFSSMPRKTICGIYSDELYCAIVSFSLRVKGSEPMMGLTSA